MAVAHSNFISAQKLFLSLFAWLTVLFRLKINEADIKKNLLKEKFGLECPETILILLSKTELLTF